MVKYGYSGILPALPPTPKNSLFREASNNSKNYDHHLDNLYIQYVSMSMLWVGIRFMKC